MEEREVINIKATVDAPIEKVWKCWTEPEHIKKWNNASEDWHTTVAENDLKVGGKFLSRMEAKDGSMGFDFWGIYDEVDKYELISYTLGDERKVKVQFKAEGEKTIIDQSFEAESENPIEMQKAGWQSILNNFKSYAEKADV
ncbi:SRPBCC family protein [Clostridium manihotivorum]|uniref:Polyketide cyclase n=1 Tax=Clostridium manihotivorum TaxID=2320868 RepID=A0A3R5UAI2_9CLOT|nr:SRPBCC family protein [Clostridium manihotivorum]QAA33636.1 polyketide cyclase [Clostridium manihotivorum]